VRSVEAQPVAPAPARGDDDATRAGTPRAIDPQPGASRDARVTIPDEGTVLRSAGGAPNAVHEAEVDATVARPRREASDPDADDATLMRPRQAVRAGERPAPVVAADPSSKRSRLGAIVAIAAAVVVVGAIGIAFALSGTLQGTAEPTTAPVSSEDAIVAARVPTPVVEPGERSADGATVSFPVSHANPEDGDRYRWQRADGSGTTEVSDGPVIVVTGVSASERVCVEVQVQRGSKTSETATGCTP
jgi:hypothetical protein